jgi:hypothetical protein
LTDFMSRNEAALTGDWINNTRNFHFWAHTKPHGI